MEQKQIFHNCLDILEFLDYLVLKLEVDRSGEYL